MTTVSVTTVENVIEVVGPAGVETVTVENPVSASIEVVSEAGPEGPQGETGPQGDAGPGVPVGGTAGQVLVKDSGTDYDAVWGFPAFAPVLIPGNFYGNVGNTFQTINDGVAQFGLVYFPRPTVVDRIRCQVTIAGSASTLVRMGIYTQGANGLPDALIVDAGTAAADSTGVKTITIDETLFGLVWCAVVAQGDNLQVRAGNAANALYEHGNGVTDLARRTGLQQSSVTGALPSNATPSATPTLAVPICQLRVA